MRAAGASAPSGLVWLVGLLLLAALPAAAMTNNLTYAAAFGAVTGKSTISTCAIDGTVEMTAALYSSQTAKRPLWCRRFETEVVSGSFVAILADDNGTDVSLTELSEESAYKTLADLFAKESVASAFWVEISNVRQNGEPIPEAATSVLTRGKIAGAPFAVVAERAERSLGSFNVRGTATVSVLETQGALTVEGVTDFASDVTFNRTATFGADGLTVTGLVSKATMDGIGTFKTRSLSVSKTLTVAALAVTNGAATTLKPASAGFVAPTSLTVAGTLAAGQGVTAQSRIAADEVEATADLTIPDGGSLDWASEGSLSVPDGVYVADDENKNLVAVYETGDKTVSNGTGKDALLMLSTGASQGSSKVRVGDTDWALYGPVSSGSSVGVNLSTLTPLAPGDGAKAHWILTRNMKELSK